jgi:hypothetical protein
MAEVPPGGGGWLQVRQATLRDAAEQAGIIAQAVGELAADVSPACSPAAAAHAGWRFAGALSAIVPSWEGHLDEQSSAVSAADRKLIACADNYEAVENDLVSRAQAISLMIAG